MRRLSIRGATLAFGVIVLLLGMWAAWLEPASLTTDDVALKLHGGCRGPCVLPC